MSAREQRLGNVRTAVREAEVDGLLVADGANVSWLTGFRGDSSWAIVTQDNVWLITDGRYTEQAEAEAPQSEIVLRKDGIEAKTAEVAAQAGIGTLGFSPSALTVAQHGTLAKAFDAGELVAKKRLVEKFREVKDEDEIERIRLANAAAEAGFQAMCRQLSAGKTEQEIAILLEYEMGLAGARKPSFDSIVAARARSSLCHAESTDAVIGEGDTVLVDWGAWRDLYVSDCTRTVFLERPDDTWREVYQTVLAAQEKAIAAAAPGVRLADVDAAARSHIHEAGYGEAFCHGLGHAVGMRVHEGPSFSAKAEGELAVGNVMTVEPGIYLPGWGGVRIEDIIIIREDGAEVMTTLPKDLDAMILNQ
ncbi:M24 family metallopeptidase [bacterium]|nr:M24 family metallopeptidase [bacterium]